MFGSGFGRSASATGNMFGGASNNNNNTASSNPFGSTTNTSNPSPFGTSTTQSTGGLFGSTAAPAQQQQQTASTGFGGFGSNNNNTGATGSGLFGSNNTPQVQPTAFAGAGATAGTTSGLFGNKPATTPATSGGLFGQPATSGGLFGNNSTATNTGATGGLFGSKPAASATGGLFGGGGGAAASTAAAAPTGGLFGAKPAATGGLFGNTSTAPSTTTGGLFGAKPASTGGLFGSSTTTPAPTGGLFGSNTQQSTLGGSGSLFNANSNNNNSLMMQQQQQQQQQQLLITPLTTIAEFPEQYRREIEQLDAYIQSQVQIAEQLKTEQDEHKEIIESIPRDIEYITNKYSHTNQALANDIRALQEIKVVTDEALRDSENFFVLLQRLLTSGSKISSIEIDTYFNRKVEFYKSKINEYTGILAEIDSAIEGIERDSISDVNGMSLVVSTLKEEFKLFMELANTIADLHQKVRLLQESGK
ncbi:hypothetical protein WICPIJ_007100 [Wickerhamomyces pijperi]|uniref:Nucleoporin Nup54 alpha-helical domain-containing protein n=1 Tax=Wickerhamomyces pijperi TaxID=599730 RepID=A0A9P8Q0U7_WICPI|nr:hypothetical protein WICPIJ_007100 [Wickerhamomyces pijperi]